MCGRYRLSGRAEILASYFYAEYEGMDCSFRGGLYGAFVVLLPGDDMFFHSCLG